MLVRSGQTISCESKVWSQTVALITSGWPGPEGPDN